jgi:AraC-like DNA-binding protein
MLVRVYRERESRLAGAVVWTKTASTGAQRVLPDGCMDLIWADGTLLVAGPDTKAHLAARTSIYTGLRFPPGTAPTVFGIPAYELRDLRVALDELWNAPEVRRATNRVNRASQRGRALEDIAAQRLHDGAPPPPVIAAVARALRAGTRVAAIADALDLSARQLHRRSLHAFGYGPKTLARVLRMHRALDLAHAGVPLAETAFRTGYADQAHLAREVKAFAGVPLTSLTS